MKVALLEASHWHVPLYLDALEAPEGPQGGSGSTKGWLSSRATN